MEKSSEVMGSFSVSCCNGETAGSPQIGKDFYINTEYNDDWGANSFSSLSGGITTITKVIEGQISDFPIDHDQSLKGDINRCRAVDPEEVVAEASDYSENSNRDDRSSMSSLTNDFFPNFDAKGRFSSFGRRRLKRGRGFQLEEDCPQGKMNVPVVGFPWYSVQSMPNPQHGVNSKMCPNPGTESSHSHSVTTIAGKVESLSSQRYLNELVCCPTLQAPLPTSHVNDGDSQSLGFASFVYNRYINASQKKKILMVSSVLLFLVCILSVLVVALGNHGRSGMRNGRNGSTFQSNVELEQFDQEESYPQLCCSGSENDVDALSHSDELHSFSSNDVNITYPSVIPTPLPTDRHEVKKNELDDSLTKPNEVLSKYYIENDKNQTMENMVSPTPSPVSIKPTFVDFEFKTSGNDLSFAPSTNVPTSYGPTFTSRPIPVVFTELPTSHQPTSDSPPHGVSLPVPSTMPSFLSSG